MAKLVKGKPSSGTLIDAVKIALVKSIEERLLAPIVGNGTFQSAIVKGIIAFGLPKIFKSNSLANLGSTAFMVDCAEDLVNAILIQTPLFGSGGGAEVI